MHRCGRRSNFVFLPALAEEGLQDLAAVLLEDGAGRYLDVMIGPRQYSPGIR